MDYAPLEPDNENKKGIIDSHKASDSIAAKKTKKKNKKTITQMDVQIHVAKEYGSKYPLHLAVCARDVTKLKELLEGYSFTNNTTNTKENDNNNNNVPSNQLDINERDWHGNPPLHLAIHLQFPEIVELLLQKGADIVVKNGGGWSALQESIATKNREIITLIVMAVNSKVQGEFKKRAPPLFEALNKLPDFYCELKWEFKSWIPFVSRFCPHDTYKIYKKGSSFRVDTTLVGFQNLKWQRWNVSFVFMGDGSECPGDIVLMDHDKKTVEYAM